MTTVHDKRKEVLRSNSAPKQPSTWRTDGGEETVVIKEAPLDSAAKVQQVVVQIGFSVDIQKDETIKTEETPQRRISSEEKQYKWEKSFQRAED